MRKLKRNGGFVVISRGAEKVYEIFEKKRTATLGEIQKLTGINYNTVRSTVRNLRKYGLISQIDRGTYALISSSKGKD